MSSEVGGNLDDEMGALNRVKRIMNENCNHTPIIMLLFDFTESLQVVRLTLSRKGYVPHKEVRFPCSII